MEHRVRWMPALFDQCFRRFVFEANLDELRIRVVILAIVHTEAALSLMNLVHRGLLSREVGVGACKPVISLSTMDHFVYGPDILRN
jgi:hypothetical protein